MFASFGDFGLAKKKLESIRNGRSFQYTKGNCKHYGSKAADIGLGIAAVAFVFPLILSIFDNEDMDEQRNDRNGKTRKR